ASLVCMSVQKPQPLIWLARIFTSSWVAIGSPESDRALPAELMCFSTLAARALPKKSTRASVMISPGSVVIGVHTPDGAARRGVTGRECGVRHQAGGGNRRVRGAGGARGEGRGCPRRRAGRHGRAGERSVGGRAPGVRLDGHDTGRL